MGKEEKVHEQAFEAFAERVTDRFQTVVEVVLFGSVARGTYGASSDVDVLVLVDDLSEREEIEQAAFEVTEEYGVSVTPVIVEEGSDKTSMMEEAEKEGVAYVGG